MTNVYEYEHPIINNQLAISNENSNPRKFPTLQSWYNVINDYEFKARCPIILKNSHRNKHFTFACHLKNCDFKVLLSYCGGNVNSSVDSIKDKKNILFDDDDDIDDELGLKKHTHLVELDDDDNNNIKKETEGEDEEDEDDSIRKYTETDATPADAHVTAAIAAAVAAVQESSNDKQHPHITKEQIGLKNININNNNNNNNNTKQQNDLDDADALLEHSVRFINEDPVEGPFIVTKIYPYHNHPLEHNMPLDKFVLTKIPKILQNDLNFDTTLEDLYKKGNNSMNKFKVSLFVTESGLLDIIKQRYHLTDNDISRKFISLISRRVTTYKARFVLKKKKMGEYQDHNSNIHMIQSMQNDSSNIVPPTHQQQQQQQQPKHNNNTTTSQQTSDNDSQSQQNQNFLNVTRKLLANVNANTASTAIESNDQNNNNNGLLSDHAVMELNNANHVLNSDIQHAAQAAINENISLSKRRLTNDDQDLDSFKRLKSTNINTTLDDINIGELTNEDKLPQNIAEQLRLLSSHFKDVENIGPNSLNSTTFEDDVVVSQHHHPHQINDDENLESAIDNDDDDVVVNTNLVHHPDVDDDEILDENIQPELRGQ